MKDVIISISKAGVVIGATIFAMHSCFDSEYMRENRRQREAQEAADKLPRVIREADGCKVYAFKSGSDWHYFTRCGAVVTTERNYTVSKSCGKTTCTEHKKEVIETKGNE